MNTLLRVRFALLLFIFTLILSACSDKYSKTDLIGKWKVDSWKIESTGKTVNNKMDMKFDEDGKYLIDYGSKKESGEFWISGEFLHTQAEGKSEMSVRILGLNSDSLVIQMNRGGSMEKVVLTH